MNIDFLQAFIYGIIQGVTEFLPVSSSAHLALLPKFLHIEDPGVAFDLMMHVGTLLAVIIYFRSALIKNYSKALIIHLVIASIATVGVVLLVKNWADQYGRLVPFIAGNLIFWGIFLYFADRRSTHRSLSWLMAIIIGLGQGLAIFPGVSRSGITIASARLGGVERKMAIYFSFLLSIPIIAVGALEHLWEIYHSGSTVTFAWGTCLLGMLIAFGSGLATIHWLMKFISRQGFGIFVLYRIILAILIFIFL